MRAVLACLVLKYALTAMRQIQLSICLIGITTSIALAQSSLPGGATSLSEKHTDWNVSCVHEPGTGTSGVKKCIISLQLINPQSKQRVAAMELGFDEAERLSGQILLPFGLRLSDGIAVIVGDDEVTLSLPFSTCLPIGCLVPVVLNDRTVEAFKVNAGLKILMAAQTGTAVDVNVSLKGFTSAYNRLRQLN